MISDILTHNKFIGIFTSKDRNHLNNAQSAVIITLMTVNLLTATCLLIICVKHFYKYVIKVPKSQRPLSVTIFYVTALITILSIIFYTACAY